MISSAARMPSLPNQQDQQDRQGRTVLTNRREEIMISVIPPAPGLSRNALFEGRREDREGWRGPNDQLDGRLWEDAQEN